MPRRQVSQANLVISRWLWLKCLPVEYQRVEGTRVAICRRRAVQGVQRCVAAAREGPAGVVRHGRGCRPMQLHRATPSRSRIYVAADRDTYNGRASSVDSYCFVIGHRTLDFPLLEISRVPLLRFHDFPLRGYNDFTLARSLSPISGISGFFVFCYR